MSKSSENIPIELAKGAAIGFGVEATITAVSSLPVISLVFPVLSVNSLVGAINNEINKIVVTKEEKEYIKEVAPEYYYENINRIETSSNGKILTLEEKKNLDKKLARYYKTALTYDEKLTNLVGNYLGGFAVHKLGKIYNGWGSKVGESITQENARKNLFYDGRKVYTEKELNNLKKLNNSQNRGIEYIVETPRGNEISQRFQSEIPGSISDIKTKKGIIPALRYDNPNKRGRSYIKFDGIEVRDGQTYLIDTKTNIPYWNDKAMRKVAGTLERIGEGKRQNPDVKIIYEFPNKEAKGHFIDWLDAKENIEYRSIIDIIRVRGE